jgi:DNA-binding GntR family transcriptional regulator
VYEEVLGWAELAVDDHPSIIASLDARDGARARESTERHVRHTGEKLIQHLDSQGFWAASGSGMGADLAISERQPS